MVVGNRTGHKSLCGSAYFRLGDLREIETTKQEGNKTKRIQGIHGIKIQEMKTAATALQRPGASCTKTSVDFLLKHGVCSNPETLLRTKISGCVNLCTWIQAHFLCTSQSTWNWAHMLEYLTPPCPRHYINMQIIFKWALHLRFPNVFSWKGSYGNVRKVMYRFPCIILYYTIHYPMTQACAIPCSEKWLPFVSFIVENAALSYKYPMIFIQLALSMTYFQEC